MFSFSMSALNCSIFFFFNDTATTEIYTLSLHDALPIFEPIRSNLPYFQSVRVDPELGTRSEEHTSELQSRRDLVCRLLREKKKRETNYAGDEREKKDYNDLRYDSNV